jgi:hypothetical protein
VIWDAESLLESQIQAMRDLPIGIPALVMLSFTDQELAQLDAAGDTPHYPAVLAAILKRIASDRKERN